MGEKTNCDCTGNEKVEVHVEPTGRGVKIEVSPKSSCSTQKKDDQESKSNSKSDCGCC